MKDLVAKLRIEAESKGADRISALAGALEEIAAEGGEAAGKFDELATSLREISDQTALVDDFAKFGREVADTSAALDAAAGAVEQLAQAMEQSTAEARQAAAAQEQASQALATARANHEALRAAISGAADELKTLRQAARENGDETGEYAQKIKETASQLEVLRTEAATAKAEIKGLAADQKAAAAAQRESEQAQRKTAAEYERTVAAAGKLSTELGRQRGELERTKDALRDAGIDTLGLADKQVALKAKLQAAMEQAQRYTTVVGEMRAEAQALGPALDATFRELGIRGVQEITAEIERLQATMRDLRAQKLLPEDAARASAALTQRIEALRGELRGTPGDAREAAGGINAVGASAANAGDKLSGAVKGALAWGAALVGLNSATDLARDIIETGNAFEQLEARLANILGSTEAAGAAFQQIKELAAETPFAVRDLTESYAKLSAFGLQPSREQMLALADTAATLGGGTEALAGVTLALGQAWTKGKLQGEEMLQLAERGVPVWDLLANATGRTTAELQKMASAGQLGRDAILQLIDAMGQNAAGASSAMMATFAGAVSNAQDALKEFYNLIAESGVLEYLNRQLQNLLIEFEAMKDSGELKRVAEDIADGFVKTADAVTRVLDLLSGMGPVVEAAFRLWTASKILSVVAAYQAVVPAVTAAAVATEKAGTRVVAANTRMATSATLTATSLHALKDALRLTIIAAGVDGWIQFADAVADVQRRTEALAAAQESHSDTAQRLAERYRQLSEETGLAIANTADFNAAVAEGALVFSEAQGRWVTGAQALEAVATAAEDTAAALATADVSKIVGEFDALVEEGAKAAEALREIGSALDVTNVDSLASFSQAMRELEESGKASAREIGAAWEAALEKLDAGELAAFAVTAETAFEQGKIAAQELAAINDQVLSASFKRLGLDAQVALGKISPAAQDAITALDNIVDGLQRAGIEGAQAGKAIETALDAAFAKADSLEALEQLEQRLQALGKSAGISAAGMERLRTAAADARQRIEDLTPGIQSAEEAMRQLGIQSDAELERIAEGARQAFEAVREMGGSAREQAEAFTVYAEAAVAANDGIVSGTLQAQAAQQGLVVQVSETGDVIVQKMGAAAEAVKKLKEETEASAEAAGEVAKAWDEAGNLVGASMADAARAHNEATQSIRRNWLSAAEMASDYAREAVAAVEANGTWGRSYAELAGAASAYVRAMEAIDERQSNVLAGTDGAAEGVERLKLRLLELEGTEDEIAKARLARDQAAIEREIALVRLEAQRAQVRGDTDEASRLYQEVKLLQEQLVLVEKIFNAEKKRAKQGGSAGGGSGGGRDSGQSSGGGGGAAAPRTAEAVQNINVAINLHPGVDLKNRAETENIARALIPAINNLNRRGF